MHCETRSTKGLGGLIRTGGGTGALRSPWVPLISKCTVTSFTDLTMIRIIWLWRTMASDVRNNLSINCVVWLTWFKKLISMIISHLCPCNCDICEWLILELFSNVHALFRYMYDLQYIVEITITPACQTCHNASQTFFYFKYYIAVRIYHSQLSWICFNFLSYIMLTPSWIGLSIYLHPLDDYNLQRILYHWSQYS